jgi:cytochrome bd-type quinol oxidase subunit 2
VLMRASFFCGKLLPLDRCRGDTYFLPPVRNGAGADTKHVMTRVTRIELFALIGAGAVGAGVHAAIAPEHLHEWAPLGASFVAVAVLLAAAVAAVVIRRADRRPVAALSVLLAAVATGYLVTRLVAVPPLDPERESFDALGICTSAVEVFGVVLAVHITLIRR